MSLFTCLSLTYLSVCLQSCLSKLGPLPRILRDVTAALANPGGVANHGGVSVSSPEPQRLVSPPPLSPPPLSPPLSPPLATCNPSIGLQGGVGLDGGLASCALLALASNLHIQQKICLFKGKVILTYHSWLEAGLKSHTLFTTSNKKKTNVLFCISHV